MNVINNYMITLRINTKYDFELPKAKYKYCNTYIIIIC